jgi:hypothetical protein
MQVTDDSSARAAEQLAQGRPAVERWLTWSGLIPLPAFLVLHLARELVLAYATDVASVARPAPGALALVTSYLLVWLPLSVHALLGVFRLLSKDRTAAQPADVPSQTRTISRVTSVVALAFLLYHGRDYATLSWLGEGDARDGGFRLIEELSTTRAGVPVAAGLYVVGLLATLVHAGLASHRGLLREGWLTTPSRRLRSARLCTAFALLLFGVGAISVIRVASGVLLR